MTDATALKRKIAALQMMAPVRPVGLRIIWEIEVDGEMVRMEDMEIDGHEGLVTLFTVFNPDINADTMDAFGGNVMDRTEAESLIDPEGERRAVSFVPTPTRALQALAMGGGIAEGMWLCHCEGGGRIVERLPKGGTDNANTAIARLVNRLSIQARAMLIGQAGGFYMEGALAEVVEDAGKSLTSAEEKSEPEAAPPS